MNAGADIESRANGEGYDKEDEPYWHTPLHRACFYGNTSFVRFLLEAKADINSRTNQGLDTPLCIAAVEGHADVARVSFMHAVIHIYTTERNHNGNPPPSTPTHPDAPAPHNL